MKNEQLHRDVLKPWPHTANAAFPILRTAETVAGHLVDSFGSKGASRLVTVTAFPFSTHV